MKTARDLAVVVGVAVFAASAAWAAQGAAGKKAVQGRSEVKLADPAGDVHPITSSSDEEYPGLDVVELALSSDGADLIVTATLKEKLDRFASTALELLIDTDDDVDTGGKPILLEVGGFERQVELNSCLEYTNGNSACIGGFDAEVKKHYAVATVQRYTGEGYTTERVVGSFDARPFPSDGKVVSAKVKYGDLGVKPGQTVRIVAREGSAGSGPEAYFPDVLLKLR